MTACLNEITVLSVCYNSKDIIATCLAPLMGAKQVIVVDNASQDGSASAVEKGLPGVTVIRNKTNKGYGGGINSGLSEVKTPYLLIVNPDSKISIGDVERLFEALQKYEGAAFVSPQLDVPRHGLENWVMGPLEYVHRKADFKPDGDFCSWFMAGTVNLCRTKVLQDLGGFDENIFLYQEDLDMCLRIVRAGHSIVCVPAAVAHHLNSQSAGGPSTKLQWRKDWNFSWSTLYVLGKFAEKSVLWKEVRRILTKHGLKSLFYALVLDKKRFIRDGAATLGCLTYLCGGKPKRPL